MAVAPNATDAQLEAEVRAKYPQMAWALGVPDLRTVLFNAARNGWDAATLQGELYKTPWWQTTSVTARNFQQLQGTDPASAEQQIQAQIAHVSDAALAMGHDPTGNPLWTRDIAYKSLMYGWTDEQLNDYLLGEFHVAPGGRPSGPGTVANTMAQLEQLAAAYFVPLSNEQALDMAHRVVTGGNSVEDLATTFRDQARQWFPQFAEQLDQGQTMTDIYAPIQGQIASLLEINPATIDPMNDRKWLTPMDYVDEKTGEHRPMAMYEVQQWVRGMDEWRNTNQAREASSGLGQTLLEKFGKVA